MGLYMYASAVSYMLLYHEMTSLYDMRMVGKTIVIQCVFSESL